MKPGFETNGGMAESSTPQLPEPGPESLIAPPASGDSPALPERWELPPPAQSWGADSAVLEESPSLPPPAETWGGPDPILHVPSEPSPAAVSLSLALEPPAESWNAEDPVAPVETACPPAVAESIVATPEPPPTAAEVVPTPAAEPVSESASLIPAPLSADKPIEPPVLQPTEVAVPPEKTAENGPPVAVETTETAAVTSTPLTAESTASNPPSPAPVEVTPAPAPAPTPEPNPFTPAPAPEAKTPTPFEFVEASAKPFAWQPFTFSGVAAFAGSSLTHLMLVQLFMAVFAGGAMVLFVDRNISPVIQGAVEKLPESAAIHNGRLEGVTSGVLSERKCLSIAVDMEGAGQLGQSADLQVELHRENLSFCPMFRTLAGVMVVDYPPGRSVTLGRSAAEPWWGAWRPVLYAGLFFGTAIALMLIWMALATVYTLVVRLMAYYVDRSITLGGSWKLAYAALMPGAAVMISGILLYGWQWLDLLGLLIFVAGHFVVAWVYLLVAPLRLPRIASVAAPTNPFDRK